jgi:hypothetical protein
MAQTAIQELDAIRKGSVRVLIGEAFDSLVDIGALRNPVFNSLVENQSIEFDNTDPLRKFVKGQRVQVTFDLAEINFDNLAKLDDGIINLTTVAGTIVNNATQVKASGAWAFETFFPIEHQNGDGSALVVDSVVGSVDGALTEDVDFHVAIVNGVYGIVVHNTGSGGVSTLVQNITVTYDYTPNASKKITFNDQGNKVLKCMRIVNTDENDKEFRIDIEEGTNFAALSLTFAADDADDVATLPVDFQGKIVEWVDEQNVA